MPCHSTPTGNLPSSRTYFRSRIVACSLYQSRASGDNTFTALASWSTRVPCISMVRVAPAASVICSCVASTPIFSSSICVTAGPQWCSLICWMIRRRLNLFGWSGSWLDMLAEQTGEDIGELHAVHVHDAGHGLAHIRAKGGVRVAVDEIGRVIRLVD